MPHLTELKKVLLSGFQTKVNGVLSKPRTILYQSILYNTSDQPTKKMDTTENITSLADVKL